jgi:excinuclease ABC subunit A
VLYVLDEPSIGLHSRDNRRLLQTLEEMRDLGNSMIVVEHDEETIRTADWIVDMGPGAGVRGGEVVAAGPMKKILKSKASLTAAYLQGKERIPVPGRRRPSDGPALVVRKAREHNLKSIDARFPLGCFVAVTGVSGSGKSTLVNDILYRALARRLHGAADKPGAHAGITGVKLLDKVVAVTQAPIGRTPRSNPATYTGVFTTIRNLFSRVPEARARGYTPGRFSFNVKGGRCEECQGGGSLKIEMHFLPDVYVTCSACGGRRYSRETLDVRYRGRTIADVLEMTVDESLEVFENVPDLARILGTLSAVGLGYLHLGQSATTLSGGEAQRVKLSRHLARRATGRTLLLLDEPTTGLHFEDVRRLLGVLQDLVDAGNTVIVIEHHLDVVKNADYIIDLGPEGGAEGGEIVATGTPEEVAGCESSWTGRYLRDVLRPARAS